MRVALLGTGLMGAPMGARILAAGHELAAWNRTPAKARSLAEAGARLADSPAGAVRDAEVVLVMVSDGPAVRSVLFEQGAAEALADGALVVDTSSIAPAMAREHAERLAARGAGHLDAPVSGGTRGAQEGTLTIMAGGSAADFERARPVLEACGRPTLVGGPGTGQLAKCVNQLIVAVTIGAVSEGLLLAEAAGADPRAVRDALLGGFADSRILQEHGRRMLEREFRPGAAVALQLKDLRAVAGVAEERGVELPVTDTVTRLFESLAREGGAGLDHSALLLELERRNGRRGDGWTSG